MDQIVGSTNVGNQQSSTLDACIGVFRPPILISWRVPARTAWVAFFTVVSFLWGEAYDARQSHSMLAGGTKITGSLSDDFLPDRATTLEAVTTGTIVNQ